jgi:uncharacterized protein YkwD
MIRFGSSSAGARVVRAAAALTLSTITLGGVALGTAAPASAAAPTMSAASQLAIAFEWAIDVERGQVGLAPLVVDPAVSQQAQEWSGGMALFNILAEDRSYVAEMSTDVPHMNRYGENVGVGPNAASLEAALMSSPPHRANMLGNYTHVGVGVFVGCDGRVWVTERFYG